MRKTIELEVTNEQAEQIYNNLVRLSGDEFAGRWFQGSLMDEFAFSVDNTNWRLKMLKGRPILGRKYVFAREKYVNCWTSKLVLVLTDNKNKFKKFVESRFKRSQDLNEVDYENYLYDVGMIDD